MSSKTEIANAAMIRLGELQFTDVDTDGTNPANVFNAIYEIVVAEALEKGPEKGWEFARWEASGIDVDSTSITAFVLATSTTTTVTSTTHGLVTNDLATITDTTNYNGDFVITKVDTNSFTIVKAFVADDATGTVSWTSHKFAYRYAKPTSIAITTVSSGGMELTDWTRRGQWILTSQQATEVDMSYIRVLADLTVTDFPPHFVDVLWRRFTVHLAYDLVQSRSLGEQLLLELETIFLPRAIGMDAREQFVQEFNNDWRNAGHTGGSRQGFNLPKLSASQIAQSNI